MAAQFKDGDTLTAAWKIYYTKPAMLIIQLVYGLEAVMPIIFIYTIYGINYAKNILIDMLGNT
tara:strand:- start:15311 stop:15499 length:189 start_codon:yes stop_codon:yes gene_type:complete